MPVEFLTDEQAAAYGRFVDAPSRADLDRLCFLDDDDRTLIGGRRGDASRLGFALQLVTVRSLGLFLPDPLAVPISVLDYVAEQLQIADPSCVKSYVERRSTRFKHASEIARARGYGDFASVEGELRRWLSDLEELPQAVAVMDPFHVVRLAGDALDQCRRRVQHDLHGHRGRKDDPLYTARRTLHTGADLLTDKQRARLTALFAADEHVEVEATWGIYQRMIGAYREPDRTQGRDMMTKLIESVSRAVPAALTELRRLGRTLKHRAGRRPGLLRPSWRTSTAPSAVRFLRVRVRA